MRVRADIAGRVDQRRRRAPPLRRAPGPRPRPDLAEASLAQLESLANVETHLLVSPYPDLETPLMLVAWGVRLPLDDIEDDNYIESFTSVISPLTGSSSSPPACWK